LSAMNDLAPGLPEVDMTEMAKLATLGQVVEYMNGQLEPANTASSTASATAPQPAASKLVEGTAPANDGAPAKDTVTANLGRYVLDAVEQPAIGMAQNGLFGAGKIVVTDEGTGLAKDLASALSALGVNATAVKKIPAGDLRGVIFLGGLREVANDQEATRINREAFEIAQTVAAKFEEKAAGAGVFVTVQDTGGSFGASEFAPARAWLSAGSFG